MSEGTHLNTEKNTTLEQQLNFEIKQKGLEILHKEENAQSAEFSLPVAIVDEWKKRPIYRTTDIVFSNPRLLVDKPFSNQPIVNLVLSLRGDHYVEHSYSPNDRDHNIVTEIDYEDYPEIKPSTTEDLKFFSKALDAVAGSDEEPFYTYYAKPLAQPPSELPKIDNAATRFVDKSIKTIRRTLGKK